ncbi:Ras-related protein Rab-32 [Trichoplax sp. H2]|nr:Ras-related protein Rab-32 [Trichoplax sp. H2]|eukprot:RDD37598.1 Ras-related protein Rab-32 [Trichoplax sp. H2]
MAQNNSTEKKEHLFKIIVVGSKFTGKTSIIRRYVHQYFSENYKATIGVDFALKVINWDAETVIKLQLWDIAGQDNYEKMTRVYFKDAVGAVVVYDITDTKTFESTKKWKDDVDNKVFLPDGSTVPVVLLANKCDKAKIGDHNDPEYLDKFIQDNGYIKWFETSAKTNVNIDKAFRSLVEEIYEKSTKFDGKETADPERVNLNNTNEKEGTKSSSCCF